jgi:hypothetical protein
MIFSEEQWLSQKDDDFHKRRMIFKEVDQFSQKDNSFDKRRITFTKGQSLSQKHNDFYQKIISFTEGQQLSRKHNTFHKNTIIFAKEQWFLTKAQSFSLLSEDLLLQFISNLDSSDRDLLRLIQIEFLSEDRLYLLDKHFWIPPESIWHYIHHLVLSSSIHRSFRTC